MFGNEHPDHLLLVIRQHHADLRQAAESHRIGHHQRHGGARPLRIRLPLRIRPRPRSALIARRI